MTYTRMNKGVCSRSTTVTLEDGIVTDIQVDNGCDGNLKGICALIKGRPAEECSQILKGFTCGSRSTSCPDQIAICLEEALAEQQA